MTVTAPSIDSAAIERLLALLGAHRFGLTDEKETQREIGEQLTAAGIAHRREVRLGPGDVIDFMVGAVGIEVKLRSTSKPDILRQLRRYAGHAELAGLVLVTNRAMGLPAEIAGKPAWYVSLGRAWL